MGQMVSIRLMPRGPRGRSPSVAHAYWPPENTEGQASLWLQWSLLPGPGAQASVSPGPCSLAAGRGLPFSPSSLQPSITEHGFKSLGGAVGAVTPGQQVLPAGGGLLKFTCLHWSLPRYLAS